MSKVINLNIHLQNKRKRDIWRSACTNILTSPPPITYKNLLRFIDVMQNFLTNCFIFYPKDNSFERRSISFSWAFVHAVLHSSLDTPSLIRLHATLCEFFFKALFNAEVLQRTNGLSPKMNTRPSQGTPIIWSLCLNPLKHSYNWFITTNLKPKALDSTLFCFLEHQHMVELLRNTMNPILDLFENVSGPLSASTFPKVSKPMPLGLGKL